MVSERYESMARESRWSSYCVFDAMACDAIPQKNGSLKKEVVDIQSIAANIKQQLRDHMAKLDQQFKEMIEELRIIRSQSGSYIENPTKPGDYPQLEIKSASFTLNKEVSDLSDDKPVITAIIVDDEKGNKEEGENGEKVLPNEKRRELVVGEGSSDYIFDLGGYESTKPRCADSPESGELGWRLDPGSDPPDGNLSMPLIDSSSGSSMIPSTIEDSYEYEELGRRSGPDPDPSDGEVLPPQVGESVESSTISSSKMSVVGIGTNSSIHISANTRKETVEDDQAWPNPCMGLETAQVSRDPFASNGRLLSSMSHQNPSVSRDQPFDLQENQSSGSYKAKYGDTKWEKAEVAGSRTGKIQGILEGTDQLSPPVESDGSTIKEQFPATNNREITNFVSLKTSSFPPFIKLHKTINLSLTISEFRFKPNPYPKLSPYSTTTNFIIRPNLNPKLAWNSNSEPTLKLPNQWHQSFNTVGLLFPCPILKLTNIDQLLLTHSSLLRLLSYQLTPNCKNIRNWSGVCLVNEAVWQKDRYEGFRVWDWYLFFISSSKFGYGPSMEPTNKLYVLSLAETVTRLLMRNQSNVLFRDCVVVMCSILSGDIIVSLFTAVNHILEGDTTVVSKQLLKGAKSVVLEDSKRWSILHEYFKFFHEDYEDYKGYCELTHHGLPPKKINVWQQVRLREAHQKLAKASFQTIPKMDVGLLVIMWSKLVKVMWLVEGDVAAGHRKGWTILLEDGKSMGEEFQVKKMKYFPDPMDKDEDKVLFWGSTYRPKHETMMSVWVQIAGSVLGVGNIYIQEKGSEIIIATRHSMIGDDRSWSFNDGAMEPDREDWIVVAADLGDVVTGQQFLYFFYPP